MSKRGLSPVIATVLLVALALVLATIIFLWARTFISELVEKDESRIENSCERVSFVAEAFFSDGDIDITNTGNVPLFGARVLEKKVIGGSVISTDKFEEIIAAGETTSLKLNDDFAVGDTMVLVPILLGETKTELKAHVCDDSFGVEVTVQS